MGKNHTELVLVKCACSNSGSNTKNLFIKFWQEQEIKAARSDNSVFCRDK